MNAKETVLEQIFSISLKVRILKAWEKSSHAETQEYSERDLLTLELIHDFTPITEKTLSKIFGVPFSSVSDIVERLEKLELIAPSEEGRGKPLVLTKEGELRLEKLKQNSAVRLNFLFESLPEEDWKTLSRIYEKIDQNAAQAVQSQVFGRFPTT